MIWIWPLCAFLIGFVAYQGGKNVGRIEVRKELGAADDVHPALVSREKARVERLATAAEAALYELSFIVWRDVGTVAAEKIVPALDELDLALKDYKEGEGTK